MTNAMNPMSRGAYALCDFGLGIFKYNMDRFLGLVFFKKIGPRFPILAIHQAYWPEQMKKWKTEK